MLLHVSETVKQGNQAIININFCLGVWFKAMILMEFPSGSNLLHEKKDRKTQTLATLLSFQV
jgi:hypothetical protein